MCHCEDETGKQFCFQGCPWQSELRWSDPLETGESLHPPLSHCTGSFRSIPAAGITRFSLPGFSQLKSRKSHVLSYDSRLLGPWVLEQLNVERIRGTAYRQNSEFTEDEYVHPYDRASNLDYQGSGFDRGHLAAAAANHKWNQQAVDETFILSNVYPQNPN
ncbi:endonuclease G, mitochondrial-like [Hyperolius riggenbachi]|uniref:endonuclease G, mitochondrial-like n=1 Tax=Hyperolius riggenbachi TaxID=752182 RepID=UPI0035A2BA44